MKNIWKERWDSCTKCMNRELLSRPCDKISALVHSVLVCGFEPLRKDFEVVVKLVNLESMKCTLKLPTLMAS